MFHPYSWSITKRGKIKLAHLGFVIGDNLNHREEICGFEKIIQSKKGIIFFD